MRMITNWIAKRAGAGITIQGVDASTGQVVKIPNVKEIYVGRFGNQMRGVIARGVDEDYNLSSQFK